MPLLPLLDILDDAFLQLQRVGNVSGYAPQFALGIPHAADILDLPAQVLFAVADPHPDHCCRWPGAFIDEQFYRGKALAGTAVDTIAHAEEVGPVALEQSPRTGISGLQALRRGRAQESGGRLRCGDGFAMEQRGIVRKVWGWLMNHPLELTADT
jgi:hypothetical protein